MRSQVRRAASIPDSNALRIICGGRELQAGEALRSAAPSRVLHAVVSAAAPARVRQQAAGADSSDDQELRPPPRDWVSEHQTTGLCCALQLKLCQLFFWCYLLRAVLTAVRGLTYLQLPACSHRCALATRPSCFH